MLQAELMEALSKQPNIKQRINEDAEFGMRIVEGKQVDTREEIRVMLANVDVVYLGGGSTHWLLGRLYGCGFDDALSAWTGLVSGASAGANCLGMHTMLQAWKCTFKPACDDTGDAALWTAAITNNTSVCGPAKYGACLFNGLEATNRAHYCHFETGDEAFLAQFYRAENSSFTPYQHSVPLALADGEAFLIGKNLFERPSFFDTKTMYDRLPLAEHLAKIKQTPDAGAQSAVRNIEAARAFEAQNLWM